MKTLSNFPKYFCFKEILLSSTSTRGNSQRKFGIKSICPLFFLLLAATGSFIFISNLAHFNLEKSFRFLFLIYTQNKQHEKKESLFSFFLFFLFLNNKNP